jgi:hypothetical protein
MPACSYAHSSCSISHVLAALHYAARPPASGTQLVSPLRAPRTLKGTAGPHAEVLAILAFECSNVIDVCAQDFRGQTALHRASTAEPPEAALEACRALCDAVQRIDAIDASIAGHASHTGRLGRLIALRDNDGCTAEERVAVDAPELQAYLRELSAGLAAGSSDVRVASTPLLARRMRTEAPVATAAAAGLHSSVPVRGSSASGAIGRSAADNGFVDELMRRRRKESDAQTQLRLRLQADTIQSPPPAGQCFLCELSGERSNIPQRSALRWPCGHVSICAVCFLNWIQSELNSKPWPELVHGEALKCNECEQPLGAEQVMALLSSAQALVPATAELEEGAPPSPLALLRRWEHVVAEVRSDEAANEIMGVLRADPAVRLCSDVNCVCRPVDIGRLPEALRRHVDPGAPFHGRVCAKLRSFSSGFVLDPPHPPWIWRILLKQLTPSALALALVIICMLQMHFWSERSSQKHVLSLAALLGALAASRLQPLPADAHQAALEAATEAVEHAQRRLDALQQRAVGRDRNHGHLDEELVREVEALSAAQARLDEVRSHRHLVEGEATRVAVCPTCDHRVCFDCDTEYEPLEQSRDWRLRWKARLAERWLACKASVGLASAHDDAVATVTHRGRSCATMAALDRSGAAAEQRAAERRAAEQQRATERRARQQEEDENATLGELQRELDRPHDDSVGTKLCPSCEFPIQKLGACLHMRCGKCAVRFCWRCGAHSMMRDPCGSYSCDNGVRRWWETGRRRPLLAPTRDGQQTLLSEAAATIHSQRVGRQRVLDVSFGLVLVALLHAAIVHAGLERELDPFEYLKLKVHLSDTQRKVPVLLVGALAEFTSALVLTLPLRSPSGSCFSTASLREFIFRTCFVACYADGILGYWGLTESGRTESGLHSFVILLIHPIFNPIFWGLSMTYPAQVLLAGAAFIALAISFEKYFDSDLPRLGSHFAIVIASVIFGDGFFQTAPSFVRARLAALAGMLAGMSSYSLGLGVLLSAVVVGISWPADALMPWGTATKLVEWTHASKGVLFLPLYFYLLATTLPLTLALAYAVPLAETFGAGVFTALLSWLFGMSFGIASFAVAAAYTVGRYLLWRMRNVWRMRHVWWCIAAVFAALAIADWMAPLNKLVTLSSFAYKGTDGQKEYAAGTLRSLAYNAENRVLIAQAGAIAPLVTLVQSGTAGQKRKAAGALRWLAFNDENEVLIAQAGAIAPLVTLVQSGTDGQKEEAAGALRWLALNDENVVLIAQAGAIAPLVTLVQSGTDGQKEQAAGALWFLAYNAENKVLIAQAGAIAPLVTLVQSGTDGQMKVAADALWTLAFNAENRVLIAQAGAIAPLVTLVQSGTDGQKEQAAGALKNLAVNAENQVLIAQAGAIAPLVTLVQSGTAGQKEFAAGALRFLALNDENQVLIAQAGG